MNDSPEKSALRLRGKLTPEGYKGLTEDERAMQRLIIEKYKKSGRVYMEEAQRVREADPKMPLGEVVKKLYEEIEAEQEKKD